MSNPDFPGSSWQDRSEFPGGPPSRYSNGRDGDYGRPDEAGWPGASGLPAGGRAAGYQREAGYGGPAGGAGYGGAGYDGPAGGAGGGAPRSQGNGPGAGGYQAGGGHQLGGGYQADAGGGRPGYDDGQGLNGGYRGGYDDHRGNGYSTNGYSGNGYGSSDNDYAGNGYDGNAYGGDGGPAGYRGSGGLAGRPDLLPGGPAGPAGPVDPVGPGSDDIGRGHARGYRGVRSRGRNAARSARSAGAAETYGPGGPAGPYGPGGGGPYGPGGGGPGGPGRRGPGGGGGRRYGGRPQDLVRPQRNPFQRLWHARWWRHWSLKKVLFLTGGLAAVLALALVLGFVVVYNHYQVPLAGIASAQQQSSVVYFSDGHTQVGTFGQINRTVLTSFPPMLAQAFFAAEDRNFLHEGGISLTGTARALYVDLSGGNLQGGSTITEQLVKNYYEAPGAPRTMSTKLAEIVVAIKLAKLESKDWILTHYLNTIFLGPKYVPGGAYGVQAAAEAYFGIPVSKLSLSQDAMIASLPKEPSLYDARPGTGYWHTQLVQRWQYVIGNMVRDGAITQQQATAARFPKVIAPRTSTLSGYKGYVMRLVYNELHYVDGYSDKTIYSGGLRVYTTINRRLMSGLYSAVRQNVATMRREGRPLPWYVHIGAVLEKPGTGQIVAFYGGPGFGVKHCRRLKCQLNTALDAQPVGSSFKPYVLATAVHQGMDVRTSVLNSHSPLCIPPDWTLADQLMQSKQTLKCDTPNGYWLFNESSENYHQNLSVPDATAYSNDPAFEDLIHRTGVQNVIDMAARLGVSSYDIAGLNALFGDHCLKHYPNCHPGSVIAALGAGSLSAVDQANTFATLVSGGWSVTPHVIKYIIQGTSKILPKVTKSQALTPAEAADADFALSFDTTLPGATGLNATWNRPVIAKTGTLGTGNNASQAWFIGAIPQYSLSVGMFTDQPQANPPQILDGLPPVGGLTGGYGGAWPATIWRTFMTEQFNNLPVLQLPTPSYGSPPFFKWVQAPKVKPKPKPKRCPNGQKRHGRGPGPGRGPCPSPSPSGSPSPSPSGSPSSSPTPTPSVTLPGAPSRQPGHSRAPAPKPVGSPSLMSAATPAKSPLRRPGWAVTSGLAG